MIYGSVCSGIEAASVAWKPLGWKCAFVSEIEPFPCAVLKHHYPEVPNFGDFTQINRPGGPRAEPIQLLVGGTPCQSFSIAGLRKGLADPRGNLALEFLALADRLRAKWLVWENVPGVLSSSGGRDFGAFLGALVDLGYGFAYRVLDAQYFGVAQRRRRVFVVANLGDWRRAASVLFERDSLQGHSAPSRETGKDIAPTISARTKGGGRLGTDFDCDGGLVTHTHTPCQLARSLNAHGGRFDGETETFVTQHGVQQSMQVRRLSPRECERLQGFPDDYTAVEYRSKPAPDGPRYKALGNSMAVPCMAWIGKRIEGVR
jgi:DNA (cytosine-5)-methyltransferase 1